MFSREKSILAHQPTKEILKHLALLAATVHPVSVRETSLGAAGHLGFNKEDDVVDGKLKQPLVSIAEINEDETAVTIGCLHEMPSGGRAYRHLGTLMLNGPLDRQMAVMRMWKEETQAVLINNRQSPIPRIAGKIPANLQGGVDISFEQSGDGYTITVQHAGGGTIDRSTFGEIPGRTLDQSIDAALNYAADWAVVFGALKGQGRELDIRCDANCYWRLARNDGMALIERGLSDQTLLHVPSPKRNDERPRG